MTHRLDDIVRELISESNLTDEQLAQRCNLRTAWFYQFRRGKIDRPNFEFLQKIFEELTGKPLVPEKPQCRALNS